MREIARLHRALPLPPARARSRGCRCGRDPPIAFSFSSLRRPWPGSSGPGQQIRDLAGRHRPRLAEHPADASGLIAAAWPQDDGVWGGVRWTAATSIRRPRPRPSEPCSSCCKISSCHLQAVASVERHVASRDRGYTCDCVTRHAIARSWHLALSMFARSQVAQTKDNNNISMREPQSRKPSAPGRQSESDSSDSLSEGSLFVVPGGRMRPLPPIRPLPPPNPGGEGARSPLPPPAGDGPMTRGPLPP
jgi:hypothetical protein